MIRKKQPGYILMLTLALIALCMFLVTYLTNKTMVFSSFSKTMVAREKARQLAYSGIELARSVLAQAAPVEKQEAGQAKPTQAPESATSKDAKLLLKNILPTLNNRQQFTLKKSIDGIEGTIAIAIGSEEGKININRLYDFNKHKFINEGQPKNDGKKFMQDIFTMIKDQTGQDLFGPFERFMAKQEYPLADVTQLLSVPEFEWFKNNIFYDPMVAKSKDSKKVDVYLTDVFTLWSSKDTLEPWLLSSSVQNLFKFKKPEQIAFDEVIKKFKETIALPKNGQELLKALYNSEFASLPAPVQAMIGTKFDPKVFWVMSSGTIANVSVSMLAILEREKSGDKNAPGYDVNIKKIYLI